MLRGKGCLGVKRQGGGGSGKSALAHRACNLRHQHAAKHRTGEGNGWRRAAATRMASAAGWQSMKGNQPKISASAQWRRRNGGIR